MSAKQGDFREYQRFVTGTACYVDDIRDENAFFVSFARSPIAFADISSISLAKALENPNVVAGYTGKDVEHLGNLSINKVLPHIVERDFPVLAQHQLTAVGQPFAAVIAKSKYEGASAVDLIELEYDELAEQLSKASQPVVQGRWKVGDTKSPIQVGLQSVETVIHHPKLAPAAMEPRAIYVKYLPEVDGIHVYLSSQTPHRARAELSRILGVDIAKVQVTAPDVGGAFGGKGSLYPEEVFVAWAALELKRNLRWTASRSEEFLSATHGRGATSIGKLTFTTEGEFIALHARVECPIGNWSPNSFAIPCWNAGRILPGPYKINNLDIEVAGIPEKKAPVGIYRGAGRPEAALLMERLVEKAAAELNMSVNGVRQKNLLPTETLPLMHHADTEIDSGNYGKLLSLLTNSDEYISMFEELERQLAQGTICGIGHAVYIEPCGKGWESAKLVMDGPTSARLYFGGSSQGHCRETSLARIIADELDLDTEQVVVKSGSSVDCPAGIGALASRSTAIGGSAALIAARHIKKQLKERKAQFPVEADVRYEAKGEAWGSGAYAALVSICEDTGVPTCQQITAMDDIGNAIVPELVDGQIKGGIAQGLGEALLERILYDDDGQLISGSFMDYAMPRATDMPTVSCGSICTPSPFNALGAKGVGEAGTIGAPAAIINAVVAALEPLGIDDVELPLSAEGLWKLIHNAKNKAN